jgi:hypothetical protein
MNTTAIKYFCVGVITFFFGTLISNLFYERTSSNSTLSSEKNEFTWTEFASTNVVVALVSYSEKIHPHREANVLIFKGTEDEFYATFEDVTNILDRIISNEQPNREFDSILKKSIHLNAITLDDAYKEVKVIVKERLGTLKLTLLKSKPKGSQNDGVRPNPHDCSHKSSPPPRQPWAPLAA